MKYSAEQRGRLSWHVGSLCRDNFKLQVTLARSQGFVRGNVICYIIQISNPLELECSGLLTLDALHGKKIYIILTSANHEIYS